MPVEPDQVSRAESADLATRRDLQEGLDDKESTVSSPATPLITPPTLTTDPAATPDLSQSEKSELRQDVAKLAVRVPGGGWTVDVQAQQAIENYGSVAVPYVWTLLADGSVDVRRGAAFYLLERFSPTNSRDVAALQATLTDPDESIRHVGLQAIKRMSDELAAQVVPQLAALLEQPGESDNNRADVARVLGRLGDEAHQACATLLRAARHDQSATVRKACLFAASRVAQPSELVTVCMEVLQADRDAGMRRQAAMRLANAGQAAAPAATGLANALEDPDEDVGKAARDALINLGESAMMPLVEKLQSDSARTRLLAVFALGRMGSVAKPAVVELAKRLNDENEEVRTLTKAAIGHIQSAP